MKTLLTFFNLDGFAVQLKNHVEDALTELQIEWKECHISDLAKVAETFQPTMTILFHPNKSVYEYQGVIQQVKGHKLLWSMEDPYESDITFDMMAYCYYIFTSDKNTADEMKKLGTANQVFYVPHACNPKVHRKMDVTWEYKSDALFVGNAYESRLEYLQRTIINWKLQLVRIVGVGYRGLDGMQGHHVIHGHISEEEMVKYINGTKLALNPHRINSDLDMANKRGITPQHLNNRFYEISAIGKPQLVEYRDDMKEEIEAVSKMKPEEYSYKARLITYYLPLLKK